MEPRFLIFKSLLAFIALSTTNSWSPTTISFKRINPLQAKAGAFFNQVPESSDRNDNEKSANGKMDGELDEIRKAQKQPQKEIQASTINGVPTRKAGLGFGQPTASIQTDPKTSKSYVGVGPVVNDVTKPEYDDQGYTLYADEKTGEKARVFEALVEYPCLFTLKIVGENSGTFVIDMLGIVASTCDVSSADSIEHTVKNNGKWTSVTVQAPVESAGMLYQLYENIDKDPRVKFKF